MASRGVLLLVFGAAMIDVSRGQTTSSSICPNVVSCYQNSIAQSGCANSAGTGIAAYTDALPPTGIYNNSCWTSPCRHGGTCVPGATNNTYTCNCPPLFVGSQCQTFFCDYQAQNNYGSQGYNIPGLGGKVGYCDNSSGTTYFVFQRRQDGSVNFYRNYSQYEQGFGNSYGEFWLGNLYLAQLSTYTWWTLRVDLWDWQGNYAYALYSNFSVSGTTTDYTLTTIGSYSGTAGDGLSQQLGMEWSTYDEDHDLWSSNCAVTYGGAWWYNACHSSNLNGEYNNTVYGVGVNWYWWKGNTYSLMKTEMKIRPAI